LERERSSPSVMNIIWELKTIKRLEKLFYCNNCGDILAYITSIVATLIIMILLIFGYEIASLK